MEWKVIAALGLLVLLVIALLAVSVLTGVNRYTKRLADPAAKPKARGFEVKTTSDDRPSSGHLEKDDHHG